MLLGRFTKFVHGVYFVGKVKKQNEQNISKWTSKATRGRIFNQQLVRKYFWYIRGIGSDKFMYIQ